MDQKDRIKSHFAKSSVQKVAIKTKRESSEAVGRIENESNWLKILNKENIGPRLLFAHEDFFVYRFVEGIFIEEFIKTHQKDEIKRIIDDLLQQCYKLDLLKVNKEEMHHPHKHIIIDKNQHATMLDFERCSKTEKPSNITQFVEYICRIKGDLKGFSYSIDKLRELAKIYKKSYQKEAFDEIVRMVD